MVHKVYVDQDRRKQNSSGLAIGDVDLAIYSNLWRLAAERGMAPPVQSAEVITSRRLQTGLSQSGRMNTLHRFPQHYGN